VPIYLQIAAGIREAIAAGIYQPGESLPSLRALALKVQCNPNTVQRAYDLLAREGAIYAQRGKGLFVSEQAASSAQLRAQQAIRRDFAKGIRAGRAAGLALSDIREIFEASVADHENTGTQE
jgi:GntR family transcriptional regulator